MSAAIPLLTCVCPSCIRRRGWRSGGVPALEVAMVAPRPATEVSNPSKTTAPSIALVSGFAAMPLIMGAGFLATFLR